MTERDILIQLIADVKNPEVANAQAAISAAKAATALFGGTDVQKRSAEEKIPQVSGGGKNEAKRARRNGKVDGRSKAARANRTQVKEVEPQVTVGEPSAAAQ